MEAFVHYANSKTPCKAGCDVVSGAVGPPCDVMTRNDSARGRRGLVSHDATHDGGGRPCQPSCGVSSLACTTRISTHLGVGAFAKNPPLKTRDGLTSYPAPLWLGGRRVGGRVHKTAVNRSVTAVTGLTESTQLLKLSVRKVVPTLTSNERRGLSLNGRC
jgi:hypothetical protein